MLEFREASCFQMSLSTMKMQVRVRECPKRQTETARRLNNSAKPNQNEEVEKLRKLDSESKVKITDKFLMALIDDQCVAHVSSEVHRTNLYSGEIRR